jgi:hypothetical protein
MNEAQAEGTEMKFIVAIFESEKLQLRLQKRKCSLDFFATPTHFRAQMCTAHLP